MVFLSHKVSDETVETVRIEMAASPDDLLDGRLRVMKKMFGFTCLIFRDLSGTGGGKISMLRLLLVIFILTVSGYYTGFACYVTIKNGLAHITETLFMNVAGVKCFLGEIFIVYWQFGRGFQRIYSVSMWAELSRSKSKVARARTICAYVIFGFSIFVSLFAFIAGTVLYYKARISTGVVGQLMNEHLLVSHVCGSVGD